MSFQVGATYVGNVTVVDIQSGTRFDLSIEQAEKSAKDLSVHDERVDVVLWRIDCLDDRAFRFSGNVAQAVQFSEDLGKAAELARGYLSVCEGAAHADAQKAGWNARLDELALLKDNWKNGHCNAPGANAIAEARAWLGKQDGLTKIYVHPANDGGVVCELTTMGLSLNIEFLNSGDVEIIGLLAGDA